MCGCVCVCGCMCMHVHHRRRKEFHIELAGPLEPYNTEPAEAILDW